MYKIEHMYFSSSGNYWMICIYSNFFIFLQNEEAFIQKPQSHEGCKTAVQVAKMKAAMKDKGDSSVRPGQILAAGEWTETADK